MKVFQATKKDRWKTIMFWVSLCFIFYVLIMSSCHFDYCDPRGVYDGNIVFLVIIVLTVVLFPKNKVRIDQGKIIYGLFPHTIEISEVTSIYQHKDGVVVETSSGTKSIVMSSWGYSTLIEFLGELKKIRPEIQLDAELEVAVKDYISGGDTQDDVRILKKREWKTALIGGMWQVISGLIVFGAILLFRFFSGK